MIKKLFLAAWLASLSFVMTATADTIWISSGGGAITYDGVKILRVEDTNIIWRSKGGEEVTRALAAVQRMKIDDEPALVVAEEAYASASWDAAVDNYQKVMKTSSKPWLRQWAAARVILAANRTGRFDSTVSAYIMLARADPAAARANKPTLPEKGSTMLDLGLKLIDEALAGKSIDATTQQQLISLRLEINRTKGDQEAAAKDVERLGQLLPADPSASGSKEALAEVRISQAANKLDSKKYAEAIDLIEKNLDAFVLPRHQADALWILAEAKYGSIGEYDKPALQDAALAYMRVVTFFQNQPGAPHVPESLFKVGLILEKLSEPREATGVYQSIVDSFPQAPLATQAKAAITRIKGGGQPAS